MKTYRILSNLTIWPDKPNEAIEAPFPRFKADSHQAACDYVRKHYKGSFVAIVEVTPAI